jgi:hypothetical protein
MKTMTLIARVQVCRRHLVWAAAYMMHHGKAHPYLMKRDFLEFLRGQIAQFGTDESTLMGHNWQSDFENQIPEAEAWVDKRFKELK